MAKRTLKEQQSFDERQLLERQQFDKQQQLEREMESILPSGRELLLPLVNLLNFVFHREYSPRERNLLASLYRHDLEDELITYGTVQSDLHIKELRKIAKLLRQAGDPYPELEYFLKNLKAIRSEYEDKYIAVTADGVAASAESEEELREKMADKDVGYFVFSILNI